MRQNWTLGYSFVLDILWHLKSRSLLKLQRNNIYETNKSPPAFIPSAWRLNQKFVVDVLQPEYLFKTFYRLPKFGRLYNS